MCPAAQPSEYDGTNEGTHSGRFCWIVAGTFCGGELQGTCAKKLMSCLECEFLRQVNEDQDRDFILTPEDARKRLTPEP